MRGSGRTALASVAMVAVVALIAWGLLGKPSALAGPNLAAASGTATTPPPSSASSGPSVSLPGGPWKVKFSAQFTGSKLNTKIWGTCYPWHDVPTGCTNYGNKHPELEWYLPKQDRVANGSLNVVAQHLPTKGQDQQGNPVTYGCRSGLVTTYPSFHFKYGYIQVVARIPYGYGLWSALWLAAANLKWPPEIDIMEHWETRTTARESYHQIAASQITKKVHAGNLSAGWHTFSLLWTPSNMTWFIDGHKGLVVHKHIPSIPMYFIANIADNRPPASQGCQGTMHIRSVEVWQQH